MRKLTEYCGARVASALHVTKLVTNFHQNCGRFSDVYTGRCMHVITLPNPIEMCYLFDFP